MEIETTIGELDQQIRRLGRPLDTHVRVIIEEPKKRTSQPSKWAKWADEIKNDKDLDDPAFNQAWKKVKEGMKEVHENLYFEHDK